MKTAVAMQSIITAIADKHSLDLKSPDFYLRLEQPDLMPLVIERSGEHLLSVAHYFTQNGDTLADPDVVFFTRYEQWVPVQITQSMFGTMDAARLSEEGASIQSLKPKAQADLAAFCRDWAANLEAQDWLNAKAVK